MRKIAKIMVVSLLIVILTMALIACNDNSTHKGEFVHEINSVDDLKKVADMVGSDYDKGVFELKNDIVIPADENWTPIGTSVENSFRGTFNGNDHTITYTINIPEPEDGRDTKAPLDDQKSFGLFGVIHNAKISKLNLSIDITVPADANSFYVGGLAGFASGNNTIDDVEVNGNVETTLGDIRKILDEETQLIEIERYDMAGFVGGVVGFIQGSTTLNNVSSTTYIKVGAYSDKAAFDDLFVGGVAGAIRTVDLSSLKDNNEYASANNLSFAGSISASGSQVNAGGIFGAAYRIKNGEKWNVSGNSINVKAYKRLRVGGLAGMIDRVTLSKAKVDLDTINAGAFSFSTSRSFNAGGAFGYVANLSSLDNVISDVKKVYVAKNTTNYTGGLVGTLHYSKLTSAVASGALYYGTDVIDDVKEIRYEGNTQNNHYYVYNGGIAGRVYGESSMANASSNFKAYQGIVGEAANAIEIIVLKDGETITDWLNSSIYNTSMLTYAKIEESNPKEGEVKYKIVHNISLDDVSLTYVETNSKAYNDKQTNDKASTWYNEIGSKKADDITYNELYNTINSNINS